MNKWVLKAAIQKTISFLPYRNKINYFFQKYVTKGVYLTDEYFGYKFEHLQDHIAHTQKAKQSKDLAGLNCMELGTGWYPVIPLGLYLCGAEKVTSIDISPLLKTSTFLTCVKAILAKKAQFDKAFPQIHAATEGSSLVDLCQQVKLEVLVADAQNLSFADNTFDLITSNNTYEHIYPSVLKGICAELWRVTAKGGVMSHFIDMSDHFAHWDQSITIYNFLQFSEKAWSRINNSIQPQNRWRLPKYEALYQTLNIPYEKAGLREGSLDALATVDVHAEYGIYTKEELAISHGYLVSVK